jgi:hypothetical protein
MTRLYNLDRQLTPPPSKPLHSSMLTKSPRRGAGNRLRSTESYDVHTQQWTERAPMNEARCAVRIAALNQCIYAVGGRSETGSFTTSFTTSCTSLPGASML